MASCRLSLCTSSIASDHLGTDALRRTNVLVTAIRVVNDTRCYRSPHAPAFVQDIEKAIITQRGFLYTERAFLLFRTRFLTVDPALGLPSHVLPYVISLTYDNEIMVAKEIGRASCRERVCQYVAMSAEPSSCSYHAFSWSAPSGEGIFHDRTMIVGQKGAQPCQLRFEDCPQLPFSAETKTIGICIELQPA